MKKRKFVKNPNGGISPNEILDGKDFFISYNPDPCGILPSMFHADAGSSETALVKSSDKQKYRILNGDFRKEYEKVIEKGFDACLALFNKLNKKYGSSWSSIA